MLAFSCLLQSNKKIALSLSGKIKNTFGKKCSDITSRLKNYCQQKHFDSTDKNNILDEHLDNRKLHLNKRGKSVFANNCRKYLRSSFGISDEFSCVRDFPTEYRSQRLFASGLNSCPNDVSEKSF